MVAGAASRVDYSGFATVGLTGNPVGPIPTISIAGNNQIALFLDQIPGFEAVPVTFRGILRVSTAAASAISIIGLRGRYNERSDYLISTSGPLNEASPPQPNAYFPHFVQSGGYTTQFILFPALTNSASGTLRFFSQLGQPINVTLR